MVGVEILIEIDATLNQLIQNAEAIAGVDIGELSLTELEAFQKTQESLLHHLLHVDERLHAKNKNTRMNQRSASYKIQEKRTKFEKLKSSYHKTISDRMKQKLPILSKRRGKRFLNRPFAITSNS
jgi:hypothetical protein